MKQPCEIVVTKIIPQIRAVVAKTLISKYEMRQKDVSEKLGITPAAVSQYLSSTRGGDETLLKMFPEIKEKAEKIAGNITIGEANGADIVSLMCEICINLRKNPNFCKYHRMFMQPDKCRICYDAEGI